MGQFPHYEDKHKGYSFKIHSFSTFDKIEKYDNKKYAESIENPYSIEIGETKRTITLYAVTSTEFEMMC